jgi:hypothetical protein
MESKWKKNIFKIWAAIFCAAIIPTGAQAVDRISYGTSQTKSSHYTYGVSAAKAINTHSGDKVDVTAVVTKGGGDNINRLGRGQIDMGTAAFASVYQCWKGLGKFKDKSNPKLRTLWLYAPAMQSWVVRADSGVNKLEDLEGKTFTSGQRGSATEQLAIQMLDVLKIKPNYFRASLNDAISAVKDKRSIGYVKAGGSTSLDGSTLELKAFTKIKLLSFTQTQKKAVQATFPYIAFRQFKDNEVKGFPATLMPLQMIGVVANSDGLSDDQVMSILSGIVKGQDIQAAAFPTVKSVDFVKDTLSLAKVPLHTGAVKFYRSMGAKIPEHLIPPEMK